MVSTLQLLPRRAWMSREDTWHLSQNRSLPSITSHHHLAGNVPISPWYLTTHWRTFTHRGKSLFPSDLQAAQITLSFILRAVLTTSSGTCWQKSGFLFGLFEKKQREQQVTISWNSISRFVRTVRDFTRLRGEQASAHIRGLLVDLKGKMTGFCSHTNSAGQVAASERCCTLTMSF